jgi:sugar phosphate isomerase/epimerase
LPEEERMKLGLHSMSYAGMWGGAFLDLEDFLDTAAELGFDGVMLMAKRPHASPLDLPADRLARLKRRLDATKLEVISVAAYNDFAGRIGADTGTQYPSGIPLLELQILHLRHCAELAHELGAPYVRVFTGYERRGLTPAEAWRVVADALGECADHAARLGVSLAVQNHHDVANHPQTLRLLVEEIGRPNVRVAYDAWVPALQGFTPHELEASAAELAPLVAYTTVADYEVLPRFRYDTRLINFVPETPELRAVPMGEGFIAYDAFFSGLRSGGFDGYAVYEMCSPLRGGGSRENLDACAGQFADWVRRFDAARAPVTR